MDPYERKSVYVGESTNAKADEGLFANDIFSYFGGQKLFKEYKIFWKMTFDEGQTSTANILAIGK